MTNQTKYTEEQKQRYTELYQGLVDLEKKVDDAKDQPAVYRRRLAILAFSREENPIDDYQREVPDDIQEDLGFDIQGLVKKIRDLGM